MAKWIEQCPFCAKRGIRTREHVWAQWLRRIQGAQVLLEGTHGERIPRSHSSLMGGPSGYEVVTTAAAPYAKWLPNVTVDVCEGCNSGWMSGLETRAMDLLDPLFQTGRPVRLVAADLVDLAIWATKSWMAYALTHPPLANPFTAEEYEAMASEPAPLARSRIWLLHSSAPQAQVSLGVSSMLLGNGVPDLVRTADNAGFGLLAAGGVVLFMVLGPDQAPDGVIEAMTPTAVQVQGVRRCWPAPRPQFFPLNTVANEVMAALVKHPQVFSDAIGLPIGADPGETDEALQEYLDGADPTVLRERWSSPFEAEDLK